MTNINYSFRDFTISSMDVLCEDDSNFYQACGAKEVIGLDIQLALGDSMMMTGNPGEILYPFCEHHA